MKTDTPRPILLKEYRPPNYLIDDGQPRHCAQPHAHARSRPPQGQAQPGRHRQGRAASAGWRAARARKRAARWPAAATGRLPAHRQGARHRVLRRAHPSRSRRSPPATREANKALTGLYLSRGIYCTQCEAQGFRRITYFLDRPDVLATYTVRLEADRNEAPVLLSNGDPVERGTLGRGKAALCGVARPLPQALLPVRRGRRQSRLVRLRLHDRLGPQGRPAHLCRARQGEPLRLGDGLRSSARCAGTRSASGASTILACSTSSPCPTSTWGRWRTRASTSSTTPWCSPRRRPPPTATSSASSGSSRTSTSTTGPATASPAATGSSSA